MRQQTGMRQGRQLFDQRACARLRAEDSEEPTPALHEDVAHQRLVDQWGAKGLPVPGVMDRVHESLAHRR